MFYFTSKRLEVALFVPSRSCLLSPKKINKTYHLATIIRTSACMCKWLASLSLVLEQRPTGQQYKRIKGHAFWSLQSFLFKCNIKTHSSIHNDCVAEHRLSLNSCCPPSLVCGCNFVQCKIDFLALL